MSASEESELGSVCSTTLDERSQMESTDIEYITSTESANAAAFVGRSEPLNHAMDLTGERGDLFTLIIPQNVYKCRLHYRVSLSS